MTLTHTLPSAASDIDRDATTFAEILVEAVKEMERTHGISNSPGPKSRKDDPLIIAIEAFDDYKIKYAATKGASVLSDEFLEKIHSALDSLPEKITPERWKRVDDETHEGNGSAFHAMFDTVFGLTPKAVAFKDSKALHNDVQRVTDLLGEAIQASIATRKGDQQIFTRPYLQLKERYNQLVEKYPTGKPPTLHADAQEILEKAVQHLFHSNQVLVTEGAKSMNENTQKFLAGLNPAFALPSQNWTDRTSLAATRGTGYMGRA